MDLWIWAYARFQDQIHRSVCARGLWFLTTVPKLYPNTIWKVPTHAPPHHTQVYDSIILFDFYL